MLKPCATHYLRASQLLKLFNKSVPNHVIFTNKTSWLAHKFTLRLESVDTFSRKLQAEVKAATRLRTKSLLAVLGGMHATTRDLSGLFVCHNCCFLSVGGGANGKCGSDKFRFIATKTGSKNR